MQADGVRILARECGRARAHTHKHIRMPLVTWHKRNSENESKCEKGTYEHEKIRNGSIARVILSASVKACASVIGDVAQVIRAT